MKKAWIAVFFVVGFLQVSSHSSLQAMSPTAPSDYDLFEEEAPLSEVMNEQIRRYLYLFIESFFLALPEQDQPAEGRPLDERYVCLGPMAKEMLNDSVARGLPIAIGDIAKRLLGGREVSSWRLRTLDAFSEGLVGFFKPQPVEDGSNQMQTYLESFVDAASLNNFFLRRRALKRRVREVVRKVRELTPVALREKRAPLLCFLPRRRPLLPLRTGSYQDSSVVVAGDLRVRFYLFLEAYLLARAPRSVREYLSELSGYTFTVGLDTIAENLLNDALVRSLPLLIQRMLSGLIGQRGRGGAME